MAIEVPDFMQGHLNDVLITEHQRACKESYWATILKLRPFKDGNKWCVLYGKDLMDGVYAFGDTPEKAIVNFEDAMGNKNGSKV